MARTIGPMKINRYTNEFKLTAVRLSKTPGVKVNDIAEALDIHPFMFSRWRTEARDGNLWPLVLVTVVFAPWLVAWLPG